jgi:class 3 adenylate cyclase/transcriptional regulator with XRE-family HTH domain
MGAAPGEAHIRTFLIADVRGYTQFTLEHGDEGAARLATAFAALAKGAVEARGGDVIELRGDEALAVFSSARQALRAAVELQERLAEHSKTDPTLPLLVAIGLDAGEAIPVGDGYRGAALNLAARLCSLAGPGEVLVSDTVINLARKLEGLTYGEPGLVQVKGFAESVKVVQVHSQSTDAVKAPTSMGAPDTARASTFGSLLRGARIAARLTQEQLAERANLSARAISDRERGVHRAPQHDTVSLLADALELAGKERDRFEAMARGQEDIAALLYRRAPASGDEQLVPPLMGFEAEQQLLERHLSGEGPSLLVLTGPARAGKTRLLREAARQGSDLGLAILEGGCQMRTVPEPYAPLLPALAHFISQQSPVRLRMLLEGCCWTICSGRGRRRSLCS